MKIFKFLVLALQMFLALPVWGIQGVFNPLPHLGGMGKKVMLNPFQRPVDSMRLFRFDGRQSKAFDDVIKEHLLDLGLSPLLEIQAEKLDEYSLRVTFLFQGRQLCEGSVLARQTQFGPVISGFLPYVSPDTLRGLELITPSYFSALKLLNQYIKEKEAVSESFTPQNLGECLFLEHDQVFPAYKISLHNESRSYMAVVGHKVFSLDRNYFSVEGTTLSYKKNIDDGELLEKKVDLLGTHHLESEHFSTYTHSVDRAESEEHVFVYDQDDIRFEEVNVFTHAVGMLSWFSDHGFKWEGLPLTLKLHPSDPNMRDNGQYLPAATVNQNPSIIIHSGTGVLLKNLTRDIDVVSHELGHHIVYSSIKSTRQIESEFQELTNVEHSLALHEGLADFFTFAKTGDSCLGESICPADSAMCYVQGQCLRTANQALRYRSQDYWDFGGFTHLKGQIVSGFLWDLRSHDETDAAEIDRISVESIKFMPVRSTYKDLIVALLASDKELHEGRNECVIVDVAKDRGFEQEVDGLVCLERSEIDEVSEDKVSLIEENASSKDEKEKKILGCGEMGREQAPSGFALFFLPLLLLVFRRFYKA